MSDFGAAWTGPAALELTAPPGNGWTAVVELRATYPDGSARRWAVETAVVGETASYTVAPPLGDTGAVTLLRGELRYVNVDGRELQPIRLKSRYLVAVGGAFSAAEPFPAPVGVGLIQDPHEEMGINYEGGTP